MMSEDSHELLRRYVREGSETAFRSLVEQHGPMVTAVACRKLGGDGAAAQDVAQEVFRLLAKKAGQLEGVVVAGWLYRQACRRAANHARAELRRRAREKVAVAQLGGGEDRSDWREEVDEAVRHLPVKDRDAVVLRFFEGRDFRSLGAELGLAEEAARKRVSRALERLESELLKRGISPKSAAAGGGMSGLVAVPLTTRGIDRILRSALGPGSSGGMAGMAALGRAALLGMVAGGLGVVATQHGDASAARNEGMPVAEMIPARSRLNGENAEQADLAWVMAEIQRISRGPAHSLGKLQMSKLLATVSIEQMPEFFTLAQSELRDGEKSGAYLEVLKRWMKEDPESALDRVLAENLGKEVDRIRGTNLIQILFSEWLQRDRPSSAQWLRAHWGEGELQESAFQGTLQEHLAMEVVDQALRVEGTDQAMAVAMEWPDPEIRQRVLVQALGKSPYSTLILNEGPAKILELQRALREFPDEIHSETVIIEMWSEYLKDHPQAWEAVSGEMQADERFQASLALMKVRSRATQRTPMAGGGVRVSFESVDPLEQVPEIIEAGRVAGIPTDEVMYRIGAAYLSDCSPEEGLKWLDDHSDLSGLDALIENRMAEVGVFRGVLVGGEGPEEELLRLADRLTDRSRGELLAEAAFSRLRARRDSEGTPLEVLDSLQERGALSKSMVEHLISSVTP
ncbi:RNA polymerase sigma factor (sigma-70 family) [Haloferula luteola]|uniref:RNA polymerase sigma factor (Sigma-70 family) n=1 Tax=Haloferula luteola TaxID=595692 RepID=A0A840V3S8_9BACT|nr:sigma-70 family RNA polymerase sigma factor [Haloferula luteola]MBB5352957.1 RNA polymerase sigma factor (sigma-70 family) [Haloferula luteola]